MKKNKVTTIGGATRDMMFYTDDMLLLDNKKDLLRQKLIGFEYGAKIYSKEVYLTYGGGGANAAVSFASLGIKAQTILSLGDDTLANDFLINLKKRKVDTRLVQSNKNIITGTSFIVNVGKANEHVIFAYRGANNLIDLSKKTINKIDTPWVYLTSLSGNFKPAMNNLFTFCSQKSIDLAWNPGSNQLKLGLKVLAKYMKKTSVFIVNRDEALELLVSVEGRGIKNNIDYILKYLHGYGQKITVVSDGAKGAYVYDGNKKYFQAAMKVKPVNTTGAGDSFGSAFVSGLMKYKWDLKKSLNLGILNSNSVITKIGAQEGLLTVKDLKKCNM